MFKMLESLRPRGYTMAAMAISIGGVLNGYAFTASFSCLHSSERLLLAMILDQLVR